MPAPSEWPFRLASAAVGHQELGSSTVRAMPSVRVSEHSELPPDVILAAARDFTDRRADMWPDVHVEYLKVHEIDESHAEVTEGNPWPIGYVWERLRYDWSDPHALRGKVIDSNLFKPGSTWGPPRMVAVELRSVRSAVSAVVGGCSLRFFSRSH